NTWVFKRDFPIRKELRQLPYGQTRRPVSHTTFNTPRRAIEMLKLMKVFALVLFATAIALPMWLATSVEGQAGTEALTTDMDAKTPNDLFNGFGALGTPIDECVAEPVAPTAR